MFAGNAASLNRKYGQGWRIADGTDGTPNLTDAFPKFGTFAQKSDTGGAKTVTPAGSVSVSTSVSVSNHTLSVAQMPSHNHDQRISNGDNGQNRLDVPLPTIAYDTRSGGNTGSAGGSNSHNHGSSASSSGSFSGSNHTNEPQFTYLVPLYFTGVAGTYP
jgi:microcystin-dependent protein